MAAVLSRLGIAGLQRRLGALTVVLSCSALLASATAAQEHPQEDARPGLAAGDSSRIMREALTAQRRFERIRTQYMPYGPSGSRDPCDEIIGRFCFHFGDRSDEPQKLEPEKEQLTEARLELIATLDSLYRQAPQLEWLVGTLVRYQVEAGKTMDALSALSACQAGRVWCYALQGFVRHHRGEIVSAETSFEIAFFNLPSEQRCEWEDVSWLLEPADAESYLALSCDERLQMAPGVWWLADPLRSIPGNARHTEHYVRRIYRILSETGEHPSSLRWGDDLAELTVRIGWPVQWLRYWWSTIGYASRSSPISQIHPEPSYHFFPSYSAISNPLGASEEDWDLKPEHSREEYAPVGWTFGELSHQTARFLRNDSLRVLSRISVAGDSALAASDSLHAVILLDRGAQQPYGRWAAVSRDPRAMTLRAAGPDDPLFAAIEVLAEHRAARTRFSIAPLRGDSTRFALSDLLVFDAGTSLPESLDEAAAAMRTSLSVERGRRIGLYWELYGLSRGDEVEISLNAAPARRGFFARLGQFLRVVPRDGAVKLKWVEASDAGGQPVARAVEIDLASLSRGSYEISLEARVNGDLTLSSHRLLEIID